MALVMVEGPVVSEPYRQQDPFDMDDVVLTNAEVPNLDKVPLLLFARRS